MPETKNNFMLLAVHTDKEFTYWLNRHAEAGWWLKENKGNTFVFVKRPYPGKRICSYTVRSDVLGVSAEDVFYDQQDDLLKSGWQLLAMGMPENLTDKTRHAFLVEVPQEDQPRPEIPLSDPDGQTALLRNALKKAVSTIVLCLIYAAILVYLPCLYFAFRAASLYAKAVRDPGMDTISGDFQSLDRAVVLNSVMLVILAAYLILDFLI